MSNPQQAPRSERRQRPPRERSSFAAAFLSLLFPGLGHAYAGAFGRGLAFAALPLLGIALGGGIALRADKTDLLAFFAQEEVLRGLFVVNIVLLIYRVVAAIDAWNVARFLNDADRARIEAATGRVTKGTRSRAPLSIVSIVGLARGRPRDGRRPPRGRPLQRPRARPRPVRVQRGREPRLHRRGRPSPSLTAGGETLEPADSADARFHADGGPPDARRQRRDRHARADPAPVGRQGAPQRAPRRLRRAAGRDVVQHRHDDRRLRGADDRRGRDVPGAARHGRRPGARQRALASGAPCTAARSTAGSPRTATGRTCGRARPRTPAGSRRSRACSASSTGSTSATTRSSTSTASRRSSTRSAGVNINVQIPVAESKYPQPGGALTRIYIPAGPQHMTGGEALIYARSRHRAQGGDFDRGRRQQRVLLSLREQMNAQAIIANLPDLVGALKESVKTDIKTKDLPKLLALAESVDTKNIRSFVFSPSYYATEFPNSDRGYIITPNVARIRQRRRPGVQGHPAAPRPPRAARGGGRDAVGPQRLRSLRARDVDGVVPRVPGDHRVGAAPPDERAAREDGDRRLQRRRGGARGHDQVPRAPVQDDGHDGDRPQGHAWTSSSPSARTRRTWTSTRSADGCSRLRARTAGASRRRPVRFSGCRAQLPTGVSQSRYSGRVPRTAAK